MITPLKNNHLKTPSEHTLPTNHDSSTLVNKVKNTWQAKTIENTKQLKLTTQEIENIKTFFTTLRVSDPKDIKNSEDHKTNFLALCKKLNRLSSEEKKGLLLAPYNYSESPIPLIIKNYSRKRSITHFIVLMR